MRFASFLIILFFSTWINAQQIPTGSWRLHLPFKDPLGLVVYEPYIYSWAQNGFFRYDVNAKEIEVLSGIQGFSSTEVSRMAKHPQKPLLVIGYQNANIDLLYEHNRIVNVSDIFRSNITGNKTINNITFQGSFVFFSCGFGVQVFNLDRMESSATYQSLSFSNVSATAILGNEVYLATNNGLFKASLPAVGVNIPSNSWQQVDNRVFRELYTLNNQLYLLADSNVLVYSGVNFTSLLPQQEYRSLVFFNNSLFASSIAGVHEISSGSVQFEAEDEVRVALRYKSQLWFGSRGYGLIQKLGAGNFEFVSPSAPFASQSGKMISRANKLYAGGGFMFNQGGASFSPNGYYVFENGIWDNSMTKQIAYLDSFTDIHALAFDPNSDDVWMAGLTDGIVRMRDFKVIDFYGPNNSPLKTESPNLISSIAFDRQKNLWVTNFNSATPLLKRAPNGTWDSISFGSIRFLLELALDNRDQKWIRVRPGSGAIGGLLVYNETATPLNFKVLSTATGNGALPDNQVNCFAVDRNGQIWVGTEKGLCVFSNPGNILSNTPSDARRIIIGRGADAGILLGDESITAILVDGGNRKWIASRSGLWLVSPDGQEILAQFNEENAPLLSNNISELGMVEATGELFITTDKGIISYRSDATKAANMHVNVKVFPNPVRPGYSGDITITGLPTDAYVKITDVAGNLIYETRANGGTAVWNGRNFSGREASSGVYLFFTSNTDGSDTEVSKVLIVR